MGIVTNPHTGPLHVRVGDLDRDGITIGLGGESINDAYYPYGRCNMLELAFAASHTLWMMTPAHQQLLLDMITVNPAKILRLQNHEIAVGNAANFVVNHEKNLRATIATHREPRYVVRNGQICAESEFKSRRVA